MQKSACPQFLRKQTPLYFINLSFIIPSFLFQKQRPAPYLVSISAIQKTGPRPESLLRIIPRGAQRIQRGFIPLRLHKHIVRIIRGHRKDRNARRREGMPAAARAEAIPARMPVREKSSGPAARKARQPSSRASASAGARSARHTSDRSPSVFPIKQKSPSRSSGRYAATLHTENSPLIRSIFIALSLLLLPAAESRENFLQYTTRRRAFHRPAICAGA